MGIIHEIPTKIRIGPYDCQVSVQADSWSDKEETWGQFHNRTFLIEIAGDFPNGMMALDTALHEINHALWACMNLKSGDDEERICAAMATGWAQVMRDNPGLLAWMMRACAMSTDEDHK